MATALDSHGWRRGSCEEWDWFSTSSSLPGCTGKSNCYLAVSGKFKNPVVAQSSWMSQLVFSICWNPEEAGSNASEGRNMLARRRQAGQEQKLPSVSLYRLPAESVAQIKGVSSCLKIRFKGVCLPASQDWTRSGFIHFKPSKNHLSQDKKKMVLLNIYVKDDMERSKAAIEKKLGTRVSDEPRRTVPHWMTADSSPTFLDTLPS